MQFKYVLLAVAAALAVNAESSKECIANKNCGDDVVCIAKCYNVPAPSVQQVNDAEKCIKECNGKESCYINCIDTHYMGNSSGAVYTDDSASNSNSNNDSAASGSSATATDGAAAATSAVAGATSVASNATPTTAVNVPVNPGNNTANANANTSGATRTAGFSAVAAVLAAAYYLL